MKRKSPKWSSLLFAACLVLLIIPQTRTPIQVAVNKLKILIWSPATLNEDDQTRLTPFTYQLDDLKGSTTSIEIGQGRVTFISYWATWCPPCIAELPVIAQLYEDYGTQMDFVLLTSEHPEVVRRFLEKNGYDLPVFIPKMAPPKELYDRSIPTNYVIDKDGRIIIKETGAADWNSEKVRAILNRLLERVTLSKL